MKTYFSAIGVMAIGAMLYSCDYKTLADAEYLQQQVYMPAAINGVYAVDDIAPEQGPSRYEIDLSARKLLIPLSIYRSGVTNEGLVMAELVIDQDAVNTMIEDGELDDDAGSIPLLLPADKMEIPQFVNIPDGSELGTFDMAVDLDFLMSHQKTRYVAGIKLKDADRNIASTLNYVVILIDTRFIVPSVAFSYKVTDDANYVVAFENRSEYGFEYVWDFGDGTETFVGTDPGTHQYPATGRYDVTLTAKGITGDIFQQVYNLRLWENITAQYIANPGPFKRKDSGGKTGILADWSYTENVTASNGKGGFYLENGGVMDFYNSSKDMSNAKIYQTFTLPAGNYRTTFTPYQFRGTGQCYYVVAKGNSLPDIEAMDANDPLLVQFGWSEDIGRDMHEFEFTLDSEMSITLGFVVSSKAKSRIQISNVSLYK